MIPKIKDSASNSAGENSEPGSQETPAATEVAPVMVEATAAHRGEIDEASYQKIWLDYQSAQILRGVRHEEMVASRTGFSPALIDYERAQLNLSRCKIKAPFAGLIGDQEVQIGQYVSAGKECCKLVDLSRIRVNGGVLESEVQHLAVGRKAYIEFPAFPGEKFKGKIVTINPIMV